MVKSREEDADWNDKKLILLLPLWRAHGDEEISPQSFLAKYFNVLRVELIVNGFDTILKDRQSKLSVKVWKVFSFILPKTLKSLNSIYSQLWIRLSANF